MQRRSLLLAAGATAASALIGRSAQAQAGTVAGAGSALPRAVFQKWIEMAGAGAGLRVTYERNGGPAAVEQLKNRSIDFASIDYPRRPAMLRENHLIQFPTVLTGVIPFVNLLGVENGQLRLTGPMLADIFLGKITKWDDPQIKAENGGLKLPATAIVPVHRTDSSGAAFLFTKYLSRESEAWAAGPRAGTLIEWPAKVGAAVNGLEAMAAKVKSTPGGISFAGVTTMKENNFSAVSLKNRAGEYVKADGASFSKAAYSVDWTTPAFSVDLVDTDAAGAWPVVGSNYVLVPDNPTAEKVEAARNTFKFFDWAFKNGYGAATELNYPAMPTVARERIASVWRRAKDPSGRPIWEA